MLPEQEALIFKYFPRLVQECDLETIVQFLIKRGDLTEDFLNVSYQGDKLHKNRLILFNLKSYNVFPGLIEALRYENKTDLANALENKSVQENLNWPLDDASHPLSVTVDVQLSDRFYDTAEYNKKIPVYSTRSKNRGHVLLINNIKFERDHTPRYGADVDEKNLRELFESMGLKVFSYTDLNSYNMFYKTKEFAQNSASGTPDMAIVIIMSHGTVIKDETMIVASDSKYISEATFRVMFNNENCPLFRKKPKIFIYHVCRTLFNGTDSTMTDAVLTNTQRTYSDMLICYPSVKGYAAHRNSVKGSWYIQMLCKVFMEHAHDLDVVSLLMKVDEELEKISQMRMWQLEDANKNFQQTSTFLNIAFKRCYLHPGLYEENDRIKHFS